MNFIQEQKKKIGEVKIHNLLPQIGFKNVKNEILTGLTASQKHISSKFFYDELGSNLFEEITHLEEYYPSRCEKEILSSLITHLDMELYDLEIVELGSGDSSKIISILEQIPEDILNTISYFPVDISQSAIEQSIQDITKRFDLNRIVGYVADFHRQLQIPNNGSARLYCFLGSTLGNFTHDEIVPFIQSIGKIMNKVDGFLLGVDMVKQTSIIEAAYNDSQGVTAQFNLNILNVVNRNMNSNFRLEDFKHKAFYNFEEQRIEMHLVAKKDVQVDFRDDNCSIIIQKGETLHTENSHKFSNEALEEIADLGGFHMHKIYSDAEGWFNLVHFTK